MARFHLVKRYSPSISARTFAETLRRREHQVAGVAGHCRPCGFVKDPQKLVWWILDLHLYGQVLDIFYLISIEDLKI
ncbi:hypothetical protein Nepgr_026314 [Nepenthes gracilis]|uniref:Uncharacterized protein n=1 Tax=Nepenthes gracilis TaxID=150966 RepID=A0AAD3T9G3_NEPGR|nr:hypothetical protein Nepgr_026314 [Nepenthes gracilis]